MEGSKAMSDQIFKRQAYLASSLVWLSLSALIAMAYMGQLELWGVIGCAISASLAFTLTSEGAAEDHGWARKFMK